MAARSMATAVRGSLCSALRFPSDVAADAKGNLFIADHTTTAFGRSLQTGSSARLWRDPCYGCWDYISENGGPDCSAAQVTRRTVAIDGAGNLFIGDITTATSVRRLTPDGRHECRGWGREGGFQWRRRSCGRSPASAFRSGVAVDGEGNLLIADSGNHRIRKVTTGGVISSVAGSRNIGFSGDGGPAVCQLN